MQTELIKAIFAAGFRVGVEAERDKTQFRPLNAKDAWASQVEWRLKSGGIFALNSEDAGSWESVPFNFEICDT